MLKKDTNMLYASRQNKTGDSRSTALRSRVINLTEQLVIEEAEAILSTCNDPGYRQLFAVSSERQRLIRYAMNRVGNVFVVESSPEMMAQHRARMVEQKPDIQKALYEGMKLLADLYSDGVYR
jgi:hypothetical protein